MSILGGVGYFYLLIAVVLLVVGLSLLEWWVFKQLLAALTRPASAILGDGVRLVVLSIAVIAGTLFLLSLITTTGAVRPPVMGGW